MVLNKDCIRDILIYIEEKCVYYEDKRFGHMLHEVTFNEICKAEELSQYSKDDSVKYYLELIYWACAYNVKIYPEKCSKEVLAFEWFKREKNKVELVCEDRSTSVFIEDLETHRRAEIQGWTMKY